MVDPLEAFRLASLKAVAHAEREAERMGGCRGGSGDGASSEESSAEAVLSKWVADHIDDPTPGFAEKKQLAQRSGLSLKQVNEWFKKRKEEMRRNVAEAEAAEARAVEQGLAQMSINEKTRAMAQRLAESLGGFDSEPGYRMMSQNMSEY